LTSLVVGSGGETKGLPDGGSPGGSNESLTDNGEVKSDSGKVSKVTNFRGFLLSSVQTVTKTILVEVILKPDLGDAILTQPLCLEIEFGSLEESESYKKQIIIVSTRNS
jgi:hypothetical protein